MSITHDDVTDNDASGYDDEDRTVHGVRAGDYHVSSHVRGVPRYSNNERNALAYLLTVPWTKGAWQNGKMLMFKMQYWTDAQTSELLLDVQMLLPRLTRMTMARALETLARAQTPDSVWHAQWDANPIAAMDKALRDMRGLPHAAAAATEG